MTRIELARRLGAKKAIAAAGPRMPPSVVEESDPGRFMAAFASAVASGGEVFLVDPDWGAGERAQLAELLSRAAAAGECAERERRGWLMIPSGGTSGRLKFARHDEETLSAAVRGFAAHFQLPVVNAVGVLPLHHVSGLMAWMRCVMTDGRYLPWAWQKLAAGDFPPVKPGLGDWVVSLVPTQLQRLLGSPAAVTWLRGCRVIFLGGAPAWPGLLTAAAEAMLPLSLSYGMTETAAMVAALQPAEFLAGERTCGAALPHAPLRLDDEGLMTVTGESVFRGVYPEWLDTREFTTPDLGRIDPQGHLSIVGRRDSVIITGGKKVHPDEVEAVLRASGEFLDVVVIGVPDAGWGEAIVACYPASQRAPDTTRAVAALMRFQRPKRFLAIAEWPRNAQGKVNRPALVAIALAAQTTP